MTGLTVRGNVFENAFGDVAGFWCDMDCSDAVIVNNVVRDNGGPGIFYEISNTGIIANNLVYHNGQTGIRVGSANTKIYNNTVVNKPGPLVQAVWVFDDNRMAPDTGATWPYVNPYLGLGPNTSGTEFANNLIVAQQPNGARLMEFGNQRDSAIQPNTTSSQYFTVLDSNIYYHLPNQSLYRWEVTDAIKTPAQLRIVSGQAWEQNTVDVVTADDPFVNRAARDFTLKPGSLPLTTAGRPLPPDVAAALGVSSGVNRGHIG
jgi:parallel beta-helix repeat protein